MLNLVTLTLSMSIVLWLAGLPLVLWLSPTFEAWDRRIAIASAPLWGVAMLALCGTWAQSTGLLPWQWTAGLLTIAAVGTATAVRARHDSRAILIEILLGLGMLIFVIGLTLLVNGSDLRRVGLAEYFPLTNSDTFNYLGMIDQLRKIGSVSSRLIYPTETFIVLDKVIHLRLGCASVVAALSDFVGIDTAPAFFLALRVGLGLAALGAVLITAAVTRNLLASAFVAVLLIGGNILLDQTVQQFLSSLLGLSQLALVLLSAIWALKNGTPLQLVFTLGVSVGAYALVSPEAHPFIVIVLLAVFFIAIAPNHSPAYCARMGLSFLAGYILLVGPLAIHYFPDLLGQLASTRGHPGDFFAAPGAILYASGVAIWDGRPLSQYTHLEQWLAWAMICGFVLGSAGCWLRAVFAKGEGAREQGVSLLLGVTGVVVLGAQLYAYATGRGFLLEKLVDYFTFLLPVLMAASIAYGIVLAGRLTSSRWRRRVLQAALWAMALGPTVLYLRVALPQKRGVLAAYERAIEASPAADTYRIRSGALKDVTGLWADLGNDPMQRFLWENRWTPVPLFAQYRAGTRFFGGVPMSSVSHVVQFSGTGIGASAVVDINRPRDADQLSRVRTRPIANYLKVSDEHGWLGPEGSSASAAWRWLSDYGRFEVFRPCTKDRVLVLELTIGPDFEQENKVEVYFGEQLLVVVRGQDLVEKSQLKLSLPLSAVCRTTSVSGSIVITGPLKGIRQIRVGGLYVAPELSSQQPQ